MEKNRWCVVTLTPSQQIELDRFKELSKKIEKLGKRIFEELHQTRYSSHFPTFSEMHAGDISFRYQEYCPRGCCSPEEEYFSFDENLLFASEEEVTAYLNSEKAK